MNDKTEQSATNKPRGTAAGGHAEIINVPGYPLMVRAVDYNTLRAQLAEAQRWLTEQRRLLSRIDPVAYRVNAIRYGWSLDEASNATKGESNG